MLHLKTLQATTKKNNGKRPQASGRQQSRAKDALAAPRAWSHINHQRRPAAAQRAYLQQPALLLTGARVQRKVLQRGARKAGSRERTPAQHAVTRLQPRLCCGAARRYLANKGEAVRGDWG